MRGPMQELGAKASESGNEFARKLYGGQTFIVCVSMTSPCSLNRIKTFL